jgi:hypothetical protein
VRSARWRRVCSLRDVATSVPSIHPCKLSQVDYLVHASLAQAARPLAMTSFRPQGE